MRLDREIKEMTLGERGRELQRLRMLIRTHKSKSRNGRCWKNDENLYDLALPEGSEGGGRMDLPFDVLIAGCRKYIKGQQRGLTIVSISG